MNRPGFAGGGFLGSRRHGGVPSLVTIAPFGLGGRDVADRLEKGSRRTPCGRESLRAVLNRSTHSRVANATASRLRQGPHRRITSVLKKPMTVSASALSWLSPTAKADRGPGGAAQAPAATDGSIPASASRSVYLIDTSCDPRSLWCTRSSVSAGRRSWMACSRASRTSSACIERETRQPTARQDAPTGSSDPPEQDEPGPGGDGGDVRQPEGVRPRRRE